MFLCFNLRNQEADTVMHKTKPLHILDIIFWPIVIVFLEAFSIKHTHFWHWQKYEKTISKYSILNIVGHSTRPIKNAFDVFFKLNMEWTLCAIYKPKNYNKEFRIGYHCRGEKKISSIILNPNEIFAVLVGPGDNNFFAISLEDEQEIELQFIGLESKYNLREKNIILY